MRGTKLSGRSNLVLSGRASRANGEGAAAPPRRSEESATRKAILDAAEAILCEEGHAALSSRRAAERAGLKSQLVHYHFGTMDELLLAVLRRREDQYFEAHAKALTSKTPLRALWDLASDVRGAELELEFLSMGIHRELIRTQLGESCRRFRQLQVAVISRVLNELGMPETTLPPGVLAFVLASVARGLVTEERLGIDLGHAEVLAYIEKRLDVAEGPVRA